MASFVQRLSQAAMTLLSRPRRQVLSDFNKDLAALHNLLNKITAEDINLDPTLVIDKGEHQPGSIAPVTYMELFENTDLTICVFILKRGTKLPLHDHPNMHGLLKVIHGSVNVQSYSVIGGSSKASEQWGDSGCLPALKHPVLTVNASDPACLLTPDEQNMHEISALDGPAAFLDILSPPYGEDARLQCERECHYYQERTIPLHFRTPDQPSNAILLLQVTSPKEFWCDRAEYKGPRISSELLQE